MKAIIGALRVNLGLDSAQFGKGLKDAQTGLKRAGAQMRRIGAGLSLAVTTPMVLAGRDAVKLAAIQEAAQAKVVQAVKSTEGAAKLSADELFRMAEGLQEASKFGDEDILDNVTAQLLTFTNVAGDEFARAQQAVLDVSTVMKPTLNPTAIQLGKALNDPVQGLSALSRSGIQFTESQKDMIASLVEAGDTAAAQGVILDELAKQFGGQAATAAETFDGKVTSLNNSWGDLKEEFGAIITEFLPPLIEALRGVVDWISNLDPKTKELGVKFGLIAAVLGPATIALGVVATAIAAVGAPVAAVIAGITGLVGAFVAFKPQIMAAADAVVAFGQDALAYLKNLPGEIVAIFAALPAQMVQIGKDIMAGIGQGIRERIGSIKDTVTGFADSLPNWVKERLGIRSPSRVFAEIGRNIMQGLGNGLEEAGAQVQGTMRSITDGLRSDVQSLFRGVLFDGESFKGSLANLFGNLSGRVFDNATSGFADALIGRIPGFAMGTNSAPGGLAWVGERGPELVNLPRGSQVIPNHQLGGMTLNQNLTINAQGGGHDPRALAAAIRPVVREETLAAMQNGKRRVTDGISAF